MRHMAGMSVGGVWILILGMCWCVHCGTVDSTNICHQQRAQSRPQDGDPVNITFLRTPADALTYEVLYDISNQCKGRLLLKVSGFIQLGTETLFPGFFRVLGRTTNPQETSTRVSSAIFVSEREVEEKWPGLTLSPEERFDRIDTPYFLLELDPIGTDPAVLFTQVSYWEVTYNLTLQLEIIGCPTDHYGQHCKMQCAGCDNGGECHTFSGECLCPPGYTGSRCQTVTKEVLLETSRIHVLYGEAVNFTCGLYPRNVISAVDHQWLFRDGQSLPPNAKQHWWTSGDGQNFTTLEFTRSTEENEGDITCIMRGDDGQQYRASHNFTLSGCPRGLYGHACDMKCSCADESEWDCLRFDGCVCKPGVKCTIQVPIDCPENRYGLKCDRECNCPAEQQCNRTLGCMCPVDNPDCLTRSLISSPEFAVTMVLAVLVFLVILVSVVLLCLGNHRGWKLCSWSTTQQFVHADYLNYLAERKNILGDKTGDTENARYSTSVAMRASMAQGGPLLDKWRLEEKDVFRGQLLGEGAFCSVYQGLLDWKKDLPIALKSIKHERDEFAQRDLLSEFQTLVDLCPHENIVQLLGVTILGGSQGLGIGTLVVEYMEHGSLLKLLQVTRKLMSTDMDNPTLPAKTFLKFAFDVTNGMAHMASKKLIHRDLAARNILISADMVAKIGDFGLSRDCYMNDLYKVKPETGKRLPWLWMAPESLEDRTFTLKSDVWSFGVLLWEISSLGCMPYPGVSNEDIFDHLLHGHRMDKPIGCPKEWADIMDKCWSWDQKSRPNFKTLQEQFKTMVSQGKGIPDLSGSSLTVAAPPVSMSNDDTRGHQDLPQRPTSYLMPCEEEFTPA